jgi:cytochrome P450
MLTALLNTEIDGEKLSEADMISFARTFLFAGNETTRHIISGMTKLMAEHPDQRQILIDEPDLIPTAIEEFFRYVSPVWGLLRTATEDTDIAGQPIAEGDLIYALYSSANRDESIWENAAELDVRRKPDPPHMGFGWGAHRCLGSNLARLEAKLTCEHLLERYPDFELAGDPVRLNSGTFNGIVSLPLIVH